MENLHFLWVNPLQMAIFNSYVSLPEGTVPEVDYGWFHHDFIHADQGDDAKMSHFTRKMSFFLKPPKVKTKRSCKEYVI